MSGRTSPAGWPMSTVRGWSGKRACRARLGLSMDRDIFCSFTGAVAGSRPAGFPREAVPKAAVGRRGAGLPVLLPGFAFPGGDARRWWCADGRAALVADAALPVKSDSREIFGADGRRAVCTGRGSEGAKVGDARSLREARNCCCC